MSIILLVEDNLNQAEILKVNLLKGSEDLNIILASNSKDAFEFALKYRIDLFILDIGLPDKSGLILADEIRKLPGYKLTWIIFITAFDQYLPKAFKKVHCYDYITKPYDIKKVKDLTNVLLQNKIIPVKENSEELLTVNCKNILFRISSRDILYIEVYHKTCSIYKHLRKYEIKRLSLKEVHSKLPEKHFIQCSKSTLVNINYIDYIEKENVNWKISLLNYPEKLIVGKNYRDTLADSFELKK